MDFFFFQLNNQQEIFYFFSPAALEGSGTGEAHTVLLITCDTFTKVF